MCLLLLITREAIRQVKMGSPEKPIDVEMGDMETDRLNPEVDVKGDTKKDVGQDRFTGLKKDELLGNRVTFAYFRWASLSG